MRLFLCCLALLMMSQNTKGHAENGLSYLLNLDIINSQHVWILQDEGYRSMKAHVLGHLHNSWCSQEKAMLIMDLIALQRPTMCVEIGVFEGASFLPAAAILKYLEQGDIYAIDPWSNNEVIKHMSFTDPHREWWSQVDMEAIYRSFQTMLRTWSLYPHCHVMRLSSEAAVKYLKPIDYLHIDGDFSREGSLNDVDLYLPKVKKGGYILLSNVLWFAEGEQTKLPALNRLQESCEIVYQLDHGNAVLLRKIVE